MAQKDFEVHDVGTGQRLNLVEDLKQKVERYESYLTGLAERECECAKREVKRLPCIPCQAKALLNG